MRLIKYLFLLFILCTVTSVKAQYTTRHYIAPSPWSYFNRYNEIVVTTLSTTPVAVTIAGSDGTVYTNSVTTVAGTPLRYRFTALNASANLSNTVLNGQGLYVSASVPVGVQVRNIASDNYTYGNLGPGDLTSCVQKGNSAFTSLGDQGLGTSFRLGYYANVTGQTCYTGESGAALYSVLAITNNTSIYVNGVLLRTLNAGQSYLFQATLGSLLTSNNSVAVNSGMRGDNNSGCADGVESQIIPISNLGTTYVVVRSNGNTGYEKSTIVATQASTTVTVRVPSTNTTTTYTLANAGDYVTINNGDGVNAYTTNYITSTSPVAVYTGSADGCEIDMIVQPPLSSCAGSFDVQTTQFLSNSNDANKVLPYFGYVIIQSDTAIVYFNGTNLETIVGNRTQIGTTGFYIIKYTSTQLGNPTTLRFNVNARINVALIESGAGYSMSAFISSINNAMPPPSASSSCLPTTFTAQGGFTSYQWYKDGVAISGANSQTFSPSVAGSYSVAGTTTACGTTAQSTSVLVNPKPNAGSDFVACANQVDTLTATSTISGGSWIALPTNPSGATLSNTTNNVSTVSFASDAGGTYKFAFSVGCSDTLTATINPLPSIAAITGTTNICIGSTTTLSNTTSGGTWSSGTPSVATISSSGVVTALSVGTSVITYTVTNANGCTNSVTTTITVNALPTVAAITGTTSVCVGATTSLSNTTTGGVWSSSNTAVANVSTSGIVTGISAGTATITYTVTNANGCVTTVATIVTINPLPIVSAIVGNMNVCVGSTTTLSNTTLGGVWSSSNTSVATINASGIVTGVNNGTSTITYTVTNANGCVTSVTAVITVNSLPTVASIYGTNNICVGATTTFTNTTASGVWSSGTPAVATISASGVITGVTAGTSVITYTVTNANGCSNSTTRTVTVNAAPTVAAITGSNNVCLGSGTITLSNATSGGSWSSSNASVATISSSGVITSIAAGTTTINYTVNGSGGCSTTQTLLFTVKAPSTSITNASICAGSSYTFNGTVYTTAGTYTKTLVNAVGCDSVATLNLTVKATSASTTNASICAGGSYIFNGTVYTTAGTYTKTLVNVVGCDSVATLVLTIKATSASTTNTSICPSALPYSWNGLTINAAGTYTKTLTNAVGCDSVATLNLTLKATSASTTNASICAGGSYTFNGTVYTTAGTYTKTLVNAVGCDSVATLILTVKATSASTTNVSICAGGSYTFNGTVYTTAGTYTKTLVNAVGCDSIATLNLTVKATSVSTTNTSICPSALPYSWNGLTINAAGTYTKTLVNAVGCDSVATLNLTVKTTSASTTNASICAGGSYTFNSTVYTTAGTYTKTLVNAVGCDSIATLVLTVKATSASTTNTSICPSALPYGWNGLTITTAGTYTKTLVNAVGCDSVATLNLTVKATSASTTNTSICPSALPYSWNGLTINTAGTYTKTLVNAVGCDSVATLNLTVKATSASTTNASICAGGSYTFNGTVYTAAGTYTKTLVNAVGCDSVATLVLTIKATSVSTTNVSICPSALPYSWNGLTINTGGTYTKTLVNVVGCDSVATLNLTVKATSASTTNTSICPSALPYSWNGLTINTAGTYTKTLVNAVGCDSVATLVLTVKATSASTTNISICPSALPYSWNGLTINTAGTYTKTLVNAVGCDSVATLNLTVKATSASTTNASICPSALPYSWNGLTITTAGTYTKTLVNAVGCDSVATLNLTVKATSASTTNISICPSALPYSWNGLTLNAAGTYTKTLVNAVGCDSVAILALTIKATSASTTNTSICPSALPYSWNGLTVNAAGTYTKTLVNAVGCDSVATLNLTVKAISASTTNASICAGGSYTFNGTVYTAAGTYTKTLVNAVGCDSVATLVLTIKATSVSTTNTSICPSALPYSWNGLTINAGGTYTKTLVNVVGCDSVATLVLIIKATSASTTNASICPSALPYSWNGLTINAAGTYTKTLVNAVGCDSIATLILTVKATSASTTNTSICPSALPYSWNGLNITTAGTYTKTLINAVGCDSIATLNLTVKATSASTTTAILCAGNTYTFNGVTYNTPGTYVAHLTSYVGCDSAATLILVGGTPNASTNSISVCSSALPYSWNGLSFTTAGIKTAHLINASGCDSAATLILTVKEALTSTTNATICGGSSYFFNGVSYTTSGTYNAYLASDLGCDSVATLVLTVLPKPNAGADKIVGFNNGNAFVTLGGIGAGIWLANTANTGTSVIVNPASAATEVKNFSTIGTYEYLYINDACSDTMKVSVLPNGNISSYVWVDTNEDGINNESTTNGINNVVIELYKEDANGNYVLTQTTTTATFNGRPGYYNFVVPENGNYKVKFPLVAQDGALTTQNLSTNTNNNSVADPANGFSPVIAINTTGSGLSLNNTTIGAGYKYVASPNCNMTASIGVNQLSQCVTNNQYQFTGNFTGGTAPFTYLWDLNDSNYANTKDVTHIYATYGEHDVTFIVKDSRGCEAHASTVQIAVGAKPKASFDIYTHTGNGDGFTFVSTSTINAGWMTYSWNLGNGTTSTLVNPMTTYAPGTYTVTLIVTGNFGCSDTITKVITVDSSNNYCSGPIANFSINNSTQCLSGNSFTFTNTSTGNSNTYTWNFGDGSVTSNSVNEQYTFTNAGTYNVTLTATNTCGTNTVTKTVIVNDAPATPSVITGPTSLVVGGVIGLSNVTSGGVWSSSNTAVATINSYGIVTGVSTGVTTITYTVTSACGSASVTTTVTVLPSVINCQTPSANFSINNSTQCLSGNSFSFTNSSVGSSLSYSWSFNNGGIINTANASKTFTQAGVYSVKLVVSNACGIDSVVKTITVNDAPSQLPAITGNGNVLAGATTLLSNTTVGGIWTSSNSAIATIDADGLVTGIATGSTTISYIVENACGTQSVSKLVIVSQPCVSTSSTTTASICAGSSYSFNGTTYTTAGTYTKNLVNAAGCDSIATLVLTVKQPTSSTTTASICAGTSYTFNGAVYTTAGTYVAHLTNAVGCDSTATLILSVNSLPQALPSISGTTSLSAGTTSLLSNSVTGGVWSSSNTNVATVDANIGLVNGISAGTAVITYTKTDACSNIVSTTAIITVTPAIIPCTVQASFSVNNAQQCVTGNQFVFTNTTTDGVAPYTYLWQISEGSTATTRDFTKVFATYGEHDVHLKVIDANGCESNASAKHIVIGAKPVANFSVLNNTGNGASKTFISASTLAAGNMSYMWDLGNGTTSTLVNPTVTYVQGTYTVKLVVSGIGTCKDSTSQVINEVGVANVSVYPNPVVNTVQVSYRAASTTLTTLKLMDLNGRIIQTQTVLPVSVGTNLSAMFDFRNLQPGSYVIHVSDAQNGFLGSKTILKQ